MANKKHITLGQMLRALIKQVARDDAQDQALQAMDEKNLDAADLPAAIEEALAQAAGETGPVGPQGPQGETGPQGEQGPAGADGYTPVKGTDYFTEADKAEMVDAVIAALPTWTGGSY